MSDRRYPDRPYVGIGGIIVHEGRVVLVKRRFEPLAGAVETGETLEACLIREMTEETGFVVEVGPVVEVLDRITRDEEGRVLYHFVLIDYLCRPVGGELRAGSDVAEAVLAEPSEFAQYELTEKALSVIERALEMARDIPPPVGQD